MSFNSNISGSNENTMVNKSTFAKSEIKGPSITPRKLNGEIKTQVQLKHMYEEIKKNCQNNDVSSISHFLYRLTLFCKMCQVISKKNFIIKKKF